VLLGTPLGNTLGTLKTYKELMEIHWEFEGNIKGTCWGQRKNGKNPPPTPPPKT